MAKDHKDLSEEFTALESMHDDLDYDVQSKAYDDRVDNLESEGNSLSSDLDDLRIRLDDLEKENEVG